jgi:hypothetical protein
MKLINGFLKTAIFELKEGRFYRIPVDEDRRQTSKLMSEMIPVLIQTCRNVYSRFLCDQCAGKTKSISAIGQT